MTTPRKYYLSTEAKAQIRQVADAMPLPIDYQGIADLLNFPISEVRNALKAKRYRETTREKRDKVIAATRGEWISKSNKPPFVAEVELNTGLEARFYRNLEGRVSEWVLQAPTKQALFVFYGSDDIVQGIRSLRANQIQGITRTQIEKRKDAKPALKEPEE